MRSMRCLFLKARAGDPVRALMIKMDQPNRPSACKISMKNPPKISPIASKNVDILCTSLKIFK